MLTSQELDQLSVSEKLQLMESLWASLRADDLPSPDWHREILEERKRKFLAGETKYIPWEEAKASILRWIS